MVLAPLLERVSFLLDHPVQTLTVLVAVVLVLWVLSRCR